MTVLSEHRATFMAPIGIGLTLFACQLMGTLWTGCGMNPARAFGPSVISTSFPTYHWIYWAGPFIGSCIAAAFYVSIYLQSPHVSSADFV
jgi:glycerol uptake facilitator-like aquaporin